MAKKRNLYLKTIPVEEAREKYFTALEPVLSVKLETIPVTESLTVSQVRRSSQDTVLRCSTRVLWTALL